MARKTKAYRRWKELVEEADYHVDAMRIIYDDIAEKPKGREDILRTLNYALGILQLNHSNLVDVEPI